MQTQIQKQNKKYLKDFFDEKEIPFTFFELTDSTGEYHLINTDVVIEFIFSLEETNEVVSKLRQLDFYNAPIVPFLEHVAKFIIEIGVE